MREMVGGCCVCSDDRGWPENPLVYCDGQSCTVAVHQGNYNINHNNSTKKPETVFVSSVVNQLLAFGK